MASGATDLVAGYVVALGDVPALLRASDAERAAAITAAVGELPADPRLPQVELRFHDRRVQIPTGTPTESHGPLRMWRSDDVLHLSYRDGVVAIATASGIVLGGEDPDLADAWRYIFHFGLPHVFALHDRFVLHAAGLVSGGGAYLVFGDSGAGKSTLVLAARENGWRALSDDLVVVRQARSGLEACGIGKPFRVPADVLSRARGNAGRGLDDARQRWVVEPYPWARGWFPVRSSIVVGHSRARRAELEQLTGKAAVEVALPSFAGSLDPRHVRRWFPIAADIGRRGGFTLRHSSDAGVRLAEAARLLELIASQTPAADTPE